MIKKFPREPRSKAKATSITSAKQGYSASPHTSYPRRLGIQDQSELMHHSFMISCIQYEQESAQKKKKNPKTLHSRIHPIMQISTLVLSFDVFLIHPSIPHPIKSSIIHPKEERSTSIHQSPHPTRALHVECLCKLPPNSVTVPAAF